MTPLHPFIRAALRVILVRMLARVASRTLLVALVIGCAGTSTRDARPGMHDTLAALVAGPTWAADIAEGSRAPAFLVGGDVFSRGARRPRLPRALAILAVEELSTLVASGALAPSCEVEMWPARDDWGRATWVVARWWPRAEARPRWVEQGADSGAELHGRPRAIVPEKLDPSKPAERVRIFADALVQPGLYALPVFAGCVWTTRAGQVVAGWLEPSRAPDFEGRALAEGWSCRRLPPPARNGGAPIVFRVGVHDGVVRWHTDVEWIAANQAEPSLATADIAAVEIPADLSARLVDAARSIDGEAEVTLPDGSRARFTRRSAALPDHQLDDLVLWLEQRYAALGIHSERITFRSRGIEQTNLIVVLPGPRSREPVILTDHIDTAFAEDVFAATGRRVPVPGADDNALATATLLVGAELLRHIPRRRPIWLVHLTGEEYPSDDLGARQLVALLISRGIRPHVWIAIDMIGWRTTGDCILQLSPSDDPRALGAAVLVERITRRVAPGLCPTLRPAGDPRSYLYNTDAMTAAAAGFSALLINEHVNALENLGRRGYHDMADVTASIDPEYAAWSAAVALVATATLAR